MTPITLDQKSSFRKVYNSDIFKNPHQVRFEDEGFRVRFTTLGNLIDWENCPLNRYKNQGYVDKVIFFVNIWQRFLEITPLGEDQVSQIQRRICHALSLANKAKFGDSRIDSKVEKALAGIFSVGCGKKDKLIGELERYNKRNKSMPYIMSAWLLTLTYLILSVIAKMHN